MQLRVSICCREQKQNRISAQLAPGHGHGHSSDVCTSLQSSDSSSGNEDRGHKPVAGTVRMSQEHCCRGFFMPADDGSCGMLR